MVPLVGVTGEGLFGSVYILYNVIIAKSRQFGTRNSEPIDPTPHTNNLLQNIVLNSPISFHNMFRFVT